MKQMRQKMKRKMIKAIETMKEDTKTKLTPDLTRRFAAYPPVRGYAVKSAVMLGDIRDIA